MKLLKCRCCAGEMDIIGNEHAINKKVKCTKCGFTNSKEFEKKEPEVVVIRKRAY